MPKIPFGTWRPDLVDYETASYSDTISNVLPRGDGYGPFPDFTAFTLALAAVCRGMFYARNTDGSITIFAGTSTKLYKLSNTNFSWIDVSKGAGSYSAVPSADQWQFEQFNNFVFAVQANTVPQIFDLTSSSAFADGLGSPPQARYITIVNRFVVLSGLLSNPYRVQWSGLNNVNASTSWDNVSLQSNFQDLPDGGIVRGVAGGEYGTILQDASIRSMVFAPGSPVIFQIERISKDDGILAPLSLIRAGDRLFFISPQGFKRLLPGGYPEPIGKEKVDRTFFADVDTAQPQLIIGANDPKANRVFWAYKSLAGQTGLFDKIICYDWVLDRFTPISVRGEYLATLAKPGLTLENLDAIAAGIITITGAASNGAGLIRLTISGLTSGLTNLNTENGVEVYGVTGTTEANGHWRFTIINSTHIDLIGSAFANAYVSGGAIGGALDALTFSLDDINSASYPQLAAVNASHMMGFFTGQNLEAKLDTGEMGDGEGRRIFVNGFRPATDAPTCFGSVSSRESAQATQVYSVENPVNAQGWVPSRVSTRYARGRVRIPAGTTWTFAQGIEPEFRVEGRR